jgi:hypothetical protein
MASQTSVVVNEDGDASAGNENSKQDDLGQQAISEHRRGGVTRNSYRARILYLDL